jgi:predicted nuclease with TOPRIM domain
MELEGRLSTLQGELWRFQQLASRLEVDNKRLSGENAEVNNELQTVETNFYRLRQELFCLKERIAAREQCSPAVADKKLRGSKTSRFLVSQKPSLASQKSID